MSTQANAWLVAGAAGIVCGIIAGLLREVSPAAVVAIFAVTAAAAIVVSQILARDADRW